MANRSPSTCSLYAFNERLSRKPLLFKSFTGLTVKEFDDIYKKEITKRYGKYELKRLSKRKDRERSIGAGRHFKLDIENRFLMLLVYYRLYITYTLTGFLFDLDQKSNVCRNIQKIENLVRQYIPIPQKIYNKTKRLRTPEDVEKYFPGLWLLPIVQNNRNKDLRTRIEERISTLARRKDILLCCMIPPFQIHLANISQ
jgi:hypothetical protein